MPTLTSATLKAGSLPVLKVMKGGAVVWQPSAGPGAYTRFRLVVADTWGTDLQTATLNLRTSSGGTPLTGTASASSQSGALTGPERAFDGNATTFHQFATGDTERYLELVVATPATISHFDLTYPATEAGYNDSSLRSGTLQGSTNGTAWFTLHTITEQPRATGGSTAYFVTGAESPPPVATAPDAPTIGTATAGDTEATFAWTAPASDGGSAILDYRLTLSTGQVITGLAGPSHTVTGLTNGVAVTGTVAARNAVGYSAESAVSNSVTPVAPAAWAPSDLWLASEPGFAFDFTDASTLSQDTAGATPVTTAGQTIGRVADISGRSNHATQATAGSRPTWQTTYASLDGTDDFMVTAATNFTGTDKVTIVAGIAPQAATSNVLVELSTGTNSNTGSFHVGAPNTTTSKFSYSRRGNGSRGYRESAAVTIPGAYVVAVSHDLSGTTHDTETPTIRVNGAVPALTNFENADTGSGNFGNHAIYIGSRNGASLRYNGRIHRMLVIGRALSAAELAEAEAWCAQPAGVTLP